MNYKELKKGDCIRQGNAPDEYYRLVSDARGEEFRTALVERVYYDKECSHPCSCDLKTHKYNNKPCFKIHLYDSAVKISRMEYLLKAHRNPEDI